MRSRTARLHSFADVASVETSLHSLVEKGSYVVKLAKLPGKRDARYGHLFSDTDYEQFADTGNSEDNIKLKTQVAELQSEIARLQAYISQLEE